MTYHELMSDLTEMNVLLTEALGDFTLDSDSKDGILKVMRILSKNIHELSLGDPFHSGVLNVPHETPYPINKGPYKPHEADWPKSNPYTPCGPLEQ